MGNILTSHVKAFAFSQRTLQGGAQRPFSPPSSLYMGRNGGRASERNIWVPSSSWILYHSSSPAPAPGPPPSLQAKQKKVSFLSGRFFNSLESVSCHPGWCLAQQHSKNLKTWLLVWCSLPKFPFLFLLFCGCPAGLRLQKPGRTGWPLEECVCVCWEGCTLAWARGWGRGWFSGLLGAGKSLWPSLSRTEAQPHHPQPGHQTWAAQDLLKALHLSEEVRAWPLSPD